MLAWSAIEHVGNIRERSPSGTVEFAVRLNSASSLFS